GKTSLLHYLKTITTTPANQLRPDQRQAWLPQPDRYRWIFVDFQDPRLGQQANLLRYLLAEMGLPDDNAGDLDDFLDMMADNLHTPTVILFDEIGVALERYPELDDAFWESLRSLATNQVGGNLGFVLAAHEAPNQLARHSGLGSPFFNIFGYTAVLTPFTESEARHLIASSPIPFSEADVTWMLEQSGGWPMPLQILCRERLMTLEEGETGSEWQAEALRQMEPFRRQKAEGRGQN
ncbi:MAG: ATP-binding protein, partial [Anaerolineae bacterium]